MADEEEEEDDPTILLAALQYADLPELAGYTPSTHSHTQQQQQQQKHADDALDYADIELSDQSDDQQEIEKPIEKHHDNIFETKKREETGNRVAEDMKKVAQKEMEIDWDAESDAEQEDEGKKKKKSENAVPETSGRENMQEKSHLEQEQPKNSIESAALVLPKATDQTAETNRTRMEKAADMKAAFSIFGTDMAENNAPMKPIAKSVSFANLPSTTDDEHDPLTMIMKQDVPNAKGILDPVEAPRDVDINDWFPNINKKSILNFTQLFVPTNSLPDEKKRNILKGSKPIKTTPLDHKQQLALHLTVMYDTIQPKQETITTLSLFKQHIQSLEDEEYIEEPAPDTAEYNLVNLDEWESRILWDAESEHPHKKIRLAVNTALDSGRWLRKIKWDDRRMLNQLDIAELDTNDSRLVIINDMDSKGRNSAAKAGSNAGNKRKTVDSSPHALLNRLQLDPYNLSNDRYYEIHRSNRVGRIRTQANAHIVSHTLPAKKLKLPFFRTQLTKAELRSWHRPYLKAAPDETFTFQPIVKAPKKKSKNKDAADLFKKVSDLTLGTHIEYGLLEYSEEYPPLMINGGMTHAIYNYYRKKDEKDTFVPALQVGGPSILEGIDSSPFGLGQVNPGQTISAVRNSLFTAPIFPHTAPKTDFLLIRHTYRRQTKYFIREIPHIHVVGQTLPSIEVPTPSSRKVNFLIRDRMRVSAMRLVKRAEKLQDNSNAKEPPPRLIQSAKLLRLYKQYNESHLRKYLKEYATILKRGSKGSWRLKPEVPTPSEEELCNLVTPEMVCWYEALRAGQQRLADAGYGTGEIEAEDDEAEESTKDDELQSAPWVITKNYLNAMANKGMLKLYGPGDPTGCGEGFSFFRFSMKNMFVREGATEAEIEKQINESKRTTGHVFTIAEQQRVYKHEINRIWNAQTRALSSSKEVEYFVDSDEEDGEGELADSEEEDDFSSIDNWRKSLKYPAKTPALIDNGVAPTTIEDLNQASMKFRGASSLGRGSQRDDETSQASSRMPGSNKVMIITRNVRNLEGVVEVKEETVTDVRIIEAYIRHKKLAQISAGGKYQINPEDTDDVKKWKLEEELKRLKLAQSRSEMREGGGGLAGPGNTDGTPKRSSTKNRKPPTCRSCGQIGHIKTNKVCPDFAINFPDTAAKDAQKAAKRESQNLAMDMP